MKKLSLILFLLVTMAMPLHAQETESEAVDEASTEELLADEAAEDEAVDGEAAEEDFFAEEDEPEESLDASIEELKKEVLSLNRDLFILEEDLLFPANTQFSVFLSMNAGALFQLDSVQLTIDDKDIANHLYTERELAALKRGGVQRLYIGNLPTGEHEVVAIFTGIGPKGRDYRRGQTITIEKTTEPQFIEFIIEDDSAKEQPQFDVRVWE